MICVALCQISILAEAPCPSITHRSSAIAAATNSQNFSDLRSVQFSCQYISSILKYWIAYRSLNCWASVLLPQPLIPMIAMRKFGIILPVQADLWGAPKGLDSSCIDPKLEIWLAQFLLVVLFDNQKTLSLFNPFGGFQDDMAESFFRSFSH